MYEPECSSGTDDLEDAQWEAEHLGGDDVADWTEYPRPGTYAWGAS